MRWFDLGVGSLLAISCVSLVVGATAVAETCSTRSGPKVATVIELYTSEGCNSCPPADRWLSTFKSNPSLVGLAFHVDYWDRLGWVDRFADPVYSQRQAREGRRNGATFSYTPQVVLNGEDYKAWHRQQSPTWSNGTATVDIALERAAEGYAATVTPRDGAPSRLAAFWAVTEHGHSTNVKAGENRGVRLAHDFVVRQYVPIAAWTARNAIVLRFKEQTATASAHPRQVNLVVIDDKTGRPVQAVKISCSSFDQLPKQSIERG